MGYCVDMIYNEFQVPSSDKKGNKTCSQMLQTQSDYCILTWENKSKIISGYTLKSLRSMFS